MIELAEQRIERILSDVIRIEGGYVNDAADRGGETRWGITVSTARAYGYTGPMAALPEATARAIYRALYVEAPRFDAVVAIDLELGAKLVDTGVHMGPTVAATFLQRWLNAFNDTGTRYAELVVDGHIGTKTLDALRAFLRWRGPMGATALLKGIHSSQGARYLDITEGNRSQRRFTFGWVIQRVGL
jgi:lysozyme family protein